MSLVRPSLSSTTSSPGAGALDPLDELIAEIARLQKVVLEELRERRERLSDELSSLDAEITELIGEAEAEEPARAEGPANAAREGLALPELIAALEAAPDKTLNIRKAHLDSKSIKALVKAHPQRLRLGGKGSWPTVTLLEQAPAESTSAEAEGSQQEFFAFQDVAPESRSTDASR